MVMERHYTPARQLAVFAVKIMTIIMGPRTDLRYYRDISRAVLAWRRRLP
jgi:hypothetical protein